jgi:hypothetical protein
MIIWKPSYIKTLRGYAPPPPPPVSPQFWKNYKIGPEEKWGPRLWMQLPEAKEQNWSLFVHISQVVALYTHKSIHHDFVYQRNKYKYFTRALSQNILYHNVSSHYQTLEYRRAPQFELHQVFPCHPPACPDLTVVEKSLIHSHYRQFLYLVDCHRYLWKVYNV